jgi:hypothetical protein
LLFDLNVENSVMFVRRLLGHGGLLKEESVLAVREAATPLAECNYPYPRG